MFESELRRYLEEVEHKREGAARSVSVRVDAIQLRSYFLGRLREFGDHAWVAALHRDLMPRLDRLACHVERAEANQGGTDQASLQRFAHRVLDQLLYRPDLDLPLVDRLEVGRVAGEFDRGRDYAELYALESRLVVRTGDDSSVTGLGRMFMRLRGKDALRWLLTAELVQNTNDFDAWRASPDLLREALTKHGIRQDLDPVSGDLDFPFAIDSLRRLNALEVLAAHVGSDDEIFAYSASEGMRDVVRSALEPGPWHAAVRALIDDERASLVGGATLAATEATIEQTRMIAHEVRNALVPVRHHIDHLMATLPESGNAPRIDAVRRGVVRVLDFVDQMVSTSELLAEPTTSFGLTEIVADVIARLEGAERVETHYAEVRARGPRTQLTRAVANVVENALQATAPAGAVRVTVRSTRRHARIEVDDGGPGVPADLRTRVFDDGFTTRPGGSGFGLFHVRRVVERDAGGKVWCEESDLGGARFVIEIPAAESTP